MTLLELGQKYGTDKVQSGYLPIYEQYLSPMRATAKKVLEIGVAGGASLRMWRDYFAEAKIIGIDHNREYCLQVAGEERIGTVCEEATHPDAWAVVKDSFGRDFDILIDDGSHFTADIITAFGFAFPLVRSGGIYAIEDMGCSFMPDYQRDNHHVGNVKNALDYSKGFIDGITKEPDYYVESIHFHKSLVIIKKR